MNKRVQNFKWETEREEEDKKKRNEENEE